MMRLLLIALIASLVSRPIEAQVQRTDLPGTHGFFVIGPDTLGVRPSASTWLATTLGAANLDSTVRMWDWQTLLVKLLDVHELDSVPSVPPPGPSLSHGRDVTTSYPWDLRRELPERTQAMLHRMWHMQSLVQIVIELEPGGYHLRVIDVKAADSLSVARYSVRDRSLRGAVEQVAQRIAADWQNSAQTRSRQGSGWTGLSRGHLTCVAAVGT